MSTKKTAKKISKKKPVAKAKKATKPKVAKATTKAGQKSVTQRQRVSNGAGKRSPEELEQLKTTLVTHVEANGGLTGEELAKALGKTTKQLAMPLRQLRADGTLTITGQRRFIRYFGKTTKAASASTKAKAKK